MYDLDDAAWVHEAHERNHIYDDLVWDALWRTKTVAVAQIGGINPTS
jgi:hypothetical protein